MSISASSIARQWRGGAGREAHRIRSKFANAVPVVCRAKSGAQHGLIVPKSLSVGQLQHEVERCIQMQKDQQIVVEVAGARLSQHVGLEHLDRYCCSGDGFIYLDVVAVTACGGPAGSTTSIS